MPFVYSLSLFFFDISISKYFKTNRYPKFNIDRHGMPNGEMNNSFWNSLMCVFVLSVSQLLWTSSSESLKNVSEDIKPLRSFFTVWRNKYTTSKTEHCSTSVSCEQYCSYSIRIVDVFPTLCFSLQIDIFNIMRWYVQHSRLLKDAIQSVCHGKPDHDL
jgi:hypothetical protein